jgi:hypothetical protein
MHSDNNPVGMGVLYPEVKLITHIHTLPMLRMSRLIPPLPYTPSRRGQGQLNLLILKIKIWR